MANTISQAQLNRRLSEVLQGKSQFTDEELGPAANMVRTSEKRLRNLSVMWKVMAAITAGLVVLLFVKMGNTSEMALRYSEAAHEEIGKWIIGIAVIGGATLFLAFMVGFGKKKLAEAKSVLVSTIRERANGASDGRKTTYESLLRQLGA